MLARLSNLNKQVYDAQPRNILLRGHVKTVQTIPQIHVSSFPNFDTVRMNVLNCIANVASFDEPLNKVCTLLCRSRNEVLTVALKDFSNISIGIVAACKPMQQYINCSEDEIRALSLWETNAALKESDVSSIMSATSRVKTVTFPRKSYVGLPWAALVTDIDVEFGNFPFYHEELVSIHNVCQKTQTNVVNAVQNRSIECLLGLLVSSKCALLTSTRLRNSYLPWVVHYKTPRRVLMRLRRMLFRENTSYDEQIHLISICLQRQCRLLDIPSLSRSALLPHANTIRANYLGLSATATPHWSKLIRHVEKLDLHTYVSMRILPVPTRASLLEKRQTSKKMPFILIPA